MGEEENTRKTPLGTVPGFGHRSVGNIIIGAVVWGSIGDATWKRLRVDGRIRTIRHDKPYPRQRDTVPQKTWRAIFARGVAKWHTYTEEEKEVWMTKWKKGGRRRTWPGAFCTHMKDWMKPFKKEHYFEVAYSSIGTDYYVAWGRHREVGLARVGSGEKIRWYHEP